MEKRSGRREIYINEGNLARRPQMYDMSPTGRRSASRASTERAATVRPPISRASAERAAVGRPPISRASAEHAAVGRHSTSRQSAERAAGRQYDSNRARQRKMRKRRQWIVAALEVLVIFIAGILLAALLNSSRDSGGKDVQGMGAGLQDFTGRDLSFETNTSAPESSVEGTGGTEFIQGLSAEVFNKHPEWEENFLTPNEYSRPGDPLTEVKNIFVHYTANPGTSAAQNRSYFEQQKDTHQASVSSHFIIGYEGEILQIVPLDEIAYAVMTRNMDSISIECCYKEKDGSFTPETYHSLIALLKWLTDAYGLDTEDILRHYDCGGKKCPLYYTDHPDAWEQLKQDVADYQP